MADPLDPHRLSPPRIYVVRMAVFIVLAGFVALILYRAIASAFMANPALNGVIFGVLFIGVVLAFRQVIRLFREVRWVNSFRRAEPGLMPQDKPVLLMPMATLLANRQGAGVSTATLRAILDTVGMRLDEGRDIGRYLTGLLVFLGLLGTFWGLLETVGSVGRVISTMKSGADAALMFEDLKSGLAAPLGGMGISFSSSLFGLAGSLVLGFLDLQAGQAQNRFYNELEDWLTTTVSEPGVEGLPALDGASDLRAVLDRLTVAVLEQGGGRNTTQALANLAEGIQALVQHMRSEQQLIRDWVEAQAAREAEMKRVLERLAPEPDRL
ncbi:flagellar motor protein MotA [Alsobacter sp. SYSU M60028]|uniref:Flagellar motor protein MotA n=1 Tax=Alsobacter ponti TaxID=2962936 RepID=A0ABT1LF88_9HYPH|nr:flagellar motor protein MotA [Alsobacter ponti]MCP8940162.1 flagellar motor protein MotA [Alsobacter ponti]